MIESLTYLLLCVLCSIVIVNYLYLPIMKILRSLSAVITLLAFLNTTSANCDDMTLYRKLKEAILTEDNMNNLQNIIYPNDGSVVTDFDLEVWITSLPCNQEYSHKACTLHISSNSKEIKSYLTKFLTFLMFTDLTFYKVLSTLTNSPHATFNIFGFKEYWCCVIKIFYLKIIAVQKLSHV